MIYEFQEDFVFEIDPCKSMLFPKATTGLSYMETYKNPTTKEVHMALVVVNKETNEIVHTVNFKVYKDDEYYGITSLFNSDGTLTEEGEDYAFENIKINEVPLKDIIETN